MAPEEIPEQIRAHLDRRAGMVHNPTGSVMTVLAEILTMYEEILRSQGWLPPERSHP